MCGLAGIVGTADARRARAATAEMLAALAHRGPDAEGLECWPGAVLGHRRLSIFDLSNAGRQPMVSEDRSVAVLLNGAIYNFRALRAELEGAGYRFRSRTDTEVLLHGYRHWGIDELVRRCRGMFSIGIWDALDNRLFLIRDRMGVKPLVYVAEKGTIAFASTVRALARGGFGHTIDDLAVAEFLEYGFVTDARTIYRGIRKLPAGSILEWHDGSFQIREYWSLPKVSRFRISFEETVEETERLFLAAVEKRLNADVPVGALLSGGVDSSLVCWGISHLGADITAYTVGTPGAVSDETDDARATAAALKIRHVVLPLSADDHSMLDDLTTAYGEPFACGSALGMLRISQVIKPSATVLLTGDGGDDVFLGYPGHAYFWWAERLAQRVPASAAGLWRHTRAVLPHNGSLGRMRHFLNYATGGLAAVVDANPGLPYCRRRGVLGARLQAMAIEERSVPESLESARNLLSDVLSYERQHRFTGEYMTKVDGGTMFYALEARSPFLDQEIWEFAASVPYDIRMQGGRLKAVLREIARRRIGDRVASGRKQGFVVPVQEWLASRWYSHAERMFADSLLARHGYIQPDAVAKELAGARKTGRAPLYLWYLFVLERWMAHEHAHAPLAFYPAAESADAISEPVDAISW
jgi:asparagine synthase (glutamine-hydrolysing)